MSSPSQRPRLTTASGGYVFPVANEHGSVLVGLFLLAKLLWIDLPVN